MDLRLVNLLKINGIGGLDVPVIHADAVLEGIDRGEDREWTAKDFPNIAPPFPRFFIEARSTFKDAEYMAGVLFIDVSETMPPDKPFKAVAPPEGSRWRLLAQGFSSIERHIFAYPGFATLHIGAQGQLLDNLKAVSTWVDPDHAEWLKANPIEQWMKNIMPLHDFMNTLPFAFTSLALMHCKNIEWVEEKPSRQVRRQFERMYKTPMNSHYVLKLKPRGDGRESGGDHAVGLMREHIRRGHFKTYTDAAPLLGKFTGTWWWESSVVGDKAKGEIKKDYEVEPS